MTDSRKPTDVQVRADGHPSQTRSSESMGVLASRFLDSPIETSAPDLRVDVVPASTSRPLVMRPTTNTEHIATSAIDVRDDVLRDEVPSIVVDTCHGVLGVERDAVVQAIEQDDTRPIRRIAAGTTPPSMAVTDARIRAALDPVSLSPLASAISSDSPLASALPDDSTQREERAQRTLKALREGIEREIERDRVIASDDRHARSDASVSSPRSVSSLLLHDDLARADLASDDLLGLALARGSSPSLDRPVAFARGSSPSLDDAKGTISFVPMARVVSGDSAGVPRMTMSRTDGGRSR